MAGPLTPRRAAALALLTAVVTGLHLWLADAAIESRLGQGAADTRPQRIQVAFVRELAPAAPPAAPPRPAPRRARPAPAAAAAPAVVPSAPAAVASAPAEPALADMPEPAASAPLRAEAPLPAASAPETAASAPPAFEWPPSTRLRYVLTGNVRGPVDGQAQVEWLRTGTRYQVHVDVSVGPPFAPLVSRRSSSDGEITELGLVPRRYDEETRVAFAEPRRLTLWFDDAGVRLTGGREAPRPPGMQDSASQFVQLTWLFTMQPALLEPGQTIDIPLALPRYVDTWTYEVLERELLFTPVGMVETVHVKPRRAARPGLELIAEVWIAPSLQYLPVRIVIRQDADTYVDLLMTQLPLQAGR